MKKSILTLLLAVSFLATSQEYKHNLKGIKKVEIFSDATIKVNSSQKKGLILYGRERNANLSLKKAEKRKGLRAVYSNGNDDTDGLGFSIKVENEILKITDLKSHFNRSDINLLIPKNVNLSVNSGNLGNIRVSGFTAELEVQSKTGNIKLTDVTGPITSNSSTGNITIVFTTVSQKSPITAHSAVGEVDVTLPVDTKASLNIKTNGTLYTNFDIKPEPKKELEYVGGRSNISENINGGGVKIKLSSSMGDIYLRKK